MFTACLEIICDPHEGTTPEPNHNQNIMFGFFTNKRGKKNAKAKIFSNVVPIDADSDWIRVVPVGDFPYHHNGPHKITSDDIERMAENFNNRSVDLLFDIDHESLWGNTKAVAWSDEVEAREDGLYAKYPTFTPAGEQLVENREYRYFSPVYRTETTDKNGDEIGATVVSVAITNTPYMDNHEIDTIRNSNHEDEEGIVGFSAEFLEALGLEEGATAEQVQSAVLAKISELEDKIKELEDDGSDAGDGDANTNSAEVKELKTLVNSLSDQLKAMQNKNTDSQVEALVNSAIEDRKILPRDKKAYINSAKANYDDTKAELDAMKKNSVAPEGVDVDKKGDEKTKVNSVQAAADFMRKANPKKKDD